MSLNTERLNNPNHGVPERVAEQSIVATPAPQPDPTATKAALAEAQQDKERYMLRIYNHDEGPYDLTCAACVKNEGRDDTMVIPGHFCTYHEVSAIIGAARAQEGGAK